MIQKTKVLAVEDDLATRAALFGLLGDESFEVTRCATADGGLVQLRARQFDVVLTDDLSMATRAHEEGLVSRARVLLLSADPSSQTQPWLTVLRKPLGPKRLVSAIGSLLAAKAVG